MKTLALAFATMMGAALVTGGSAAAEDRYCAPNAAGVCAPIHFVDDDLSRSELLRRRAYGGRYYPESAPPPAIALDGKAGYSQSYDVHRRYLDRHGNPYEDGYERPRDEVDEYYERRQRRNDAGEVIDFATDVLRGLAD